MYPLFEGRMGCFSPSVSKAILWAWVQNGGTLTHSVQDFHRADSFFCNGLEDPWLEKLLTRSFIVIHSDWILKSISEKFLMPISKYVLDDLFDSRKITSNLAEGQHNRPQTPVVPSRTKVESWRANLMKRSHEDIEDSFASIDLHPPKKPKLESMSKPPRASTILDTLPLLEAPKQQFSPPQSPPRHIDLPRRRLHPIGTVETFKRQIKVPSYVIIGLFFVYSLDETVSSHETFWTTLHDEYIKPGSTQIPITAILKAPGPVELTRFVPRKFYRQKEFTAKKR
ncbi:uncharacterized protein EV420DRAFT_1048855 [Desarmillaria tabescens]|uniref:BRCT domain-containing protein n=1 Tax=Armillaria tabescens TaxID=1929756 RepID=A0AA39NF64_ARMTA|nr:uncharacterized protein EV420DRAFT_1048855 [Desarmillaria tabescens]KAK0464527.1 hypothetical protein EV420DRAFT_1048855 [Desarmillaria tabescens]